MFALWFPFSPFFLGISLDIASWSVFAFLFIHFETDEDCVFLWCSVILFIVPFTWFLMTIRLLHSFFCLFYIWGSHQRYMFVLSHRKIPIHRLRDVYSREPRLEQQSSRVDSPCVMISIQNMYVCVYIYILYYIILYYIIYIRLPSGIPAAIGDVKWGVWCACKEVGARKRAKLWEREWWCTVPEELQVVADLE